MSQTQEWTINTTIKRKFFTYLCNKKAVIITKPTNTSIKQPTNTNIHGNSNIEKKAFDLVICKIPLSPHLTYLAHVPIKPNCVKNVRQGKLFDYYIPVYGLNKVMCGLPLIKKSFHLCALKINSLISFRKEAGTISYPLLLYTQNYTDWIKLYILIHLAKLVIFLTILTYTNKTNCLPCIRIFFHLSMATKTVMQKYFEKKSN